MNEGVLGFPSQRRPPSVGLRAFLKLEGTSVPSGAGDPFAVTALKGSYNIKKVVWSATGQFTVHFEQPMPDSHFVVSGMVKEGASHGLMEVHTSDLGLNDRKQFRTINLSGTNTNFSEVHILFFA